MPYIGKGANGFGIRETFQYTATSGQTAFTGSDINSKTLSFDNGSLVDVLLNGITLKPTTDYNTSTANTITLTSGASASDEVMIVVYDVFSLSDAMPKTGGTFSGAVTANSTLDMNGTELILDADADTSITADTDDKIQVKIGGTDKIKIDGTGSETTVFHIGDSTPLSFGTGYNEATLSVGQHFGIYSDNNSGVNTSEMMINCYNDGSNRVYATSGRHAQRVQFDTYNGNMHFSVSNATGNADANVTFVNAFSLTNSSGTATFRSASHGNGEINFYNNAMYIKSNTGEVYATDSSGNHTQLSPHNFKYIPDGKSETSAWSYLSEKTTPKKETITETIDGKEVTKEVTSERKDGDSFTYVNVDMMKVVREVEKLTGTKLVYTGTDGKDDGSTVKDDIIAGLIKRIEALEEA